MNQFLIVPHMVVPVSFSTLTLNIVAMTLASHGTHFFSSLSHFSHQLSCTSLVLSGFVLMHFPPLSQYSYLSLTLSYLFLMLRIVRFSDFAEWEVACRIDAQREMDCVGFFVLWHNQCVCIPRLYHLAQVMRAVDTNAILEWRRVVWRKEEQT